MSVLSLELVYFVKYSLRLREMLRAEPDGFPESSGYI